MATLQKITPCLWFDDQGEAAAELYVSVFPNSKILEVSRYGEAGQEIHGRNPGSVMVVAFELDGQTFTALNGGPIFNFNEAISLQVMCDTQEARARRREVMKLYEPVRFPVDQTCARTMVMEPHSPPVDLDPDLVERILGRILRTVPIVVAVYAYGSRVSGATHPASDLDLAILLPLLPRGARLSAEDHLSLIGDLEVIAGIPVDVSMLDPERRLVHCKEVVAHGALLHGPDPDAVGAFEMQVLSSYARFCRDRQPVVEAYETAARG